MRRRSGIALPEAPRRTFARAVFRYAGTAAARDATACHSAFVPRAPPAPGAIPWSVHSMPRSGSSRKTSSAFSWTRRSRLWTRNASCALHHGRVDAVGLGELLGVDLREARLKPRPRVALGVQGGRGVVAQLAVQSRVRGVEALRAEIRRDDREAVQKRPDVFGRERRERRGLCFGEEGDPERERGFLRMRGEGAARGQQ